MKKHPWRDSAVEKSSPSALESQIIMANKSTLERMPMELRQQLLRSLPDLMSLRSTILTCQSFYQAFINAQVFITTSIVTNQVDSDVLPEAVAAV